MISSFEHSSGTVSALQVGPDALLMRDLEANVDCTIVVNKKRELSLKGLMVVKNGCVASDHAQKTVKE